MEESLLVVVVLTLAFVAVVGFMIGERRRAGNSSGTKARPCLSIGEALRGGKRKHGRVLVLFLGSDEPGLTVREALTSDPAVISFLGRAEVFYAVIPMHDRLVADALFSKYAKEPLPEGPTLLLLDPEGLPIEVAQLAERKPLGTWLADWVLGQPLQGRQISSPQEELRQSGQGAISEDAKGELSTPPETGSNDDSPVAFK